MRVWIAAENASLEMGGEAAIPYHLFRVLRQRGLDAWLVVHDRCAPELLRRFPEDRNRIQVIRDSSLQKLAFRISRKMPRRLGEATMGTFTQLATQLAQRKLLRRLVAPGSVIHQPIPVSPRFPSLLFRLGAPVVIGPLNGGMEYPEPFRNQESVFSHAVLMAGRLASTLINLLLPGKRQASVVLVANERTRAVLPAGLCGRVLTMPENGVDLRIFDSASARRRTDLQPRFTFIGRLVDWKALDIALEALSRVPGATLDVIGDGPMRQCWEDLAFSLGLAERVRFHGWQSQAVCAELLSQSTALLLPSLLECGGAVVLEAMAAATPVVATEWGGPADYLDPSCGILVPPASRAALVTGFATAMQRLSKDGDEAAAMGAAGRARVLAEYDWERKVDAMLEIYAAAVTNFQNAAAQPKWARFATTAMLKN